MSSQAPITTSLISQEEIAEYLRAYITTLEKEKAATPTLSAAWHMTDSVLMVVKEVLQKVMTAEVKARTVQFPPDGSSIQ
jgi:hypothetical protein